MKKILIGGDSWGCGEWGHDGKNKHGVLHAGLEQYLVDDGFVVTNVSHGGFSNKDSIAEIVKSLQCNDYDHVIWFQSDPYRNLRPYDNFSTLFQNRNEFIKLQIDLLNQSYDQLNQLNKKIICLGGCTKLDQSINAYSNLIPAVDSIIELLIPSFSAPEFWLSDWLSVLDSSIPEDVLDLLMYCKKKQDSLHERRGLFYPDGQHPNRAGHLILYNFVKENFLDKNY